MPNRLHKTDEPARSPKTVPHASGALSASVGLVTGGTRGIGAATAIALAREGADVTVVGRRLDSEAAATCKAIEALGRRCLLLSADVAVPR